MVLVKQFILENISFIQMNSKIDRYMSNVKDK